MLISDTDKFIFIHIPKTAGSSIRSLLQSKALETPNSRMSRLLKNFNLPSDYQKFRFRFHYTLLEAEKKLPNNVFDSYKKIAFVRNPWDRVVSNYAYKVHGTSNKERNRNDSFEEFILSEITRKKRLQSDYIVDSTGKVACDFIGHFESLEEDYERMQTFLEVKLPALKKLNSSKRRESYRDYYTERTKALVAKYYEKDIELFKYQF